MKFNFISLTDSDIAQLGTFDSFPYYARANYSDIFLFEKTNASDPFSLDTFNYKRLNVSPYKKNILKDYYVSIANDSRFDSVEGSLDQALNLKLDTTSTTNVTTGNAISQIIDDLAEDFCDELLIAISSDDSQLGEPSKTKDLMVDLYNENASAFLMAYQKLWWDFFENGNDDALYSLVMKSASIPHGYFSHYAKVMVSACANHKSLVIQEATIKAVDMWGDPSFIGVLKQMRPFEIAWMERYKISVIDSLERKSNGPIA